MTSTRRERIVLAAGALEHVQTVQAEIRAGRWPQVVREGRIGSVLTGRQFPKRIVRDTGTRRYCLVGYVEWEAEDAA